ncbi:molecular chaperone FimC [Kosakonia sp. CCTCC M2018092]|uniref:type 1 fimbria chaperone FimC n=1 Tax=Kosakonia sp. CCTCC M2018092 TaxID=2492396 RepID=UPI000F60B7A9|nr:type 1 fimbria chaperone FimC [Kosakonia sp. CCTCC M2018092]AZI88550.1 molecular chaperone FimC [Kosakonia sp. CCTCC M2018092]
MQNLLRMSIAAVFLISSAVNAEGGISLGATRVIYPAEAKQTSLAVNNSDNNSRFLINSWIEDEQGQKVKTFAVTPPLFVSEPNSENTLRIIYVGPPLPGDRESLFWLNVKAIPSVEKESLAGKNVLHLAILSRIKLFVRPSTLTDLVQEAPEALSFALEGNTLKIANASSYYLSLVNMHINQRKVNNVMVAPKKSTQVALPPDARGDLTFQTVNDYGAVTPVRTVSLR